jgi:aminocarboxymuconate-semialdehyde decarboxylase
MLPRCSDNIPEPPSAYLRRLYYDDGLSGTDAIALCKGVCGTGHLVHGSDYPFGDLSQSLDWTEALDAPAREAILGNNAQRLFNL